MAGLMGEGKVGRSGDKEPGTGQPEPVVALGLGVDIWGAGFQRQRVHVDGVQVCHEGGGKCHWGGS